MIIERREFLNMLGVAAGAAGLGGCTTPWSVPDNLVEMALRGPGLESQVQTICGLCEGACGLTVRRVDGLPVGLKGNRNHPLNRGGLCPVGLAGLELLYAPNRLQGPLRRQESGEYGPIGWDEALTEIAERLSQALSAGQGSRIALLTGDPSSLFTDLARQFLSAMGSPNFAHMQQANSLPYLLTQGIDEVPGFDLSRSDLVLSFGLDLYEDGPAPLHAISALVGARQTEARSSLLHVGSRLSPSASKAEVFVPVRSGTHGAFALGVAHVLVREGLYDNGFVAEHTLGFDDWRDGEQRRPGFRRMLLERYYPDRVAQLCGCDPAGVVRVARRLAQASSPVAMAGGEATQGSNATWNAVAVHALNALMGAFGRPGGVVMAPRIPWTPLPEVKALPASDSLFAADAEAALFGSDPAEVLANRILGGDQPVDVLLIAASNPVHESPAGARIAEAMGQVPLTVAFAPFFDETCAKADLVLPSHLFLEGRQASTTPPTTAFSVVGLASPVVEPLYDTRHPADVLLEVSRKVLPENSTALPWESYEDYLKNRLEGLAKSGQGSIVTGTFEESWRHFLEERGWRFLEHQDLETFWNDLARQASWWSAPSSTQDWSRLFQTSSGRYEFFSLTLLEKLLAAGRAEDSSLGEEDALRQAGRLLGLSAEPDEVCLPHYEPPLEKGEGELVLIPFRPLTGRGSLGANSPMVMEMYGYSVLSGWQTWAELNPQTARELGVEHGDRIALESEQGSIEAVVRIQWGAAGAAHVPVGLGHQEPFGAAPAGSNPLEALLPVRDPLSGALSLNSTRVRLRLIRRRPHGEPPPIHTGGTE